METPDRSDQEREHPGPSGTGQEDAGGAGGRPGPGRPLGTPTGPGAGAAAGADGTGAGARSTTDATATSATMDTDGTDLDATDADGTDRDGRLAEQLLRLTRRLHRVQKHQMAPVGITPAQGRLLRTVAYCVTHCGGPPRMADLAARLEVVPRAVTTLVDGLEANGWVHRAPDPTNRRVIRIEVTDSGLDTLRALRTARRSAAEEVLAPLSGAQRETLGELLSALSEAPDAAGRPAPESRHGTAASQPSRPEAPPAGPPAAPEPPALPDGPAA
jgi:DNA-binding MarR family transcriptional regulator